MTHDFEIRFARSAGLAGLLEAPANPFRWKGGGRISVDGKGIVVSVRRGLASFLRQPASRRIEADKLTEVFREGAAVRVEFANDAGAREILPFWAPDPIVAADIVRAMPTRRTVEFDHPVAPGAARFAWDRRIVIALASLISGIALLAWFFWTPAATVPEPAPQVAPVAVAPPGTTAPDADATAIPEPVPSSAAESPVTPLEPAWQNMPVTVQAPEIPIHVEVHVEPITRGTPAYSAAREALQRFEAAAAALRNDYRAQQVLFQSGALTTPQFIEHLHSMEMRWWNLTFAILGDDALIADELLDFRATLLACGRHWRGFLGGYANGLAGLDHVAIARAFDRLSIAEEMQSRARRFAPP